MEKPCRHVIKQKRACMQVFFLSITFLLFSCSGTSVNKGQETQAEQLKASHPANVGVIPIPEGYKRINAADGSYTAYLRSIPLKKDNTVYLYNGIKKGNQQAQYAVLDIDAGQKDLQQCADAAMRLRAEYLYSRKQFSSITFRFTNGFYCDYEHYAQGYRLKMKGNSCQWVKQEAGSYAYPAFRQYLDLVYAYAGTKSLYTQLTTIPLQKIAPGKVFLQTRNPYGHAVTVMDMAYHPKTGDTIFLLSQSYMPAQDIHILRNPMDNKLSPWYSIHFDGNLETPEWTFTKEDLKSF
jgi:hypothetical protein